MQALLLQLAERATDGTPSFTLSFCEDRYYEVAIGDVVARAVTIEGAVARATVKMYALLKQRVSGDADVLNQLRVSVRDLENALSAEENGRQLSLLDRAVQDASADAAEGDQASRASRLDH